jgi:hypothetical protein
VDCDQHAPLSWPLLERRTPADGLPARSPQDYDIGGWPAHDWRGHADGVECGPINGDWFKVYIRHVLVPELRPGDVVVMDNLSSRKRPILQELIKAAEARLLFLPPYSPDFNTIEKGLLAP